MNTEKKIAEKMVSDLINSYTVDIADFKRLTNKSGSKIIIDYDKDWDFWTVSVKTDVDEYFLRECNIARIWKFKSREELEQTLEQAGIKL